MCVVYEGTGVVARPLYTGLFHALSSIYKEGGVRGLYQGAVPNVIGNGASWGLCLFLYAPLDVTRCMEARGHGIFSPTLKILQRYMR